MYEFDFWVKCPFKTLIWLSGVNEGCKRTLKPVNLYIYSKTLDVIDLLHYSVKTHLIATRCRASYEDLCQISVDKSVKQQTDNKPAFTDSEIRG